MSEQTSRRRRRDLTEAEREYQRLEEEEQRARRAAVFERARFEGLQIDPDVDFYPDVADREPGDTNVVRGGFDLHPVVTFWAAGLVLAFVAVTLIFSGQAQSWFDAGLAWINSTFGWFYILAANLFVFAVAYFAFSRFGKIRIGGPTAKPEFTRLSWFSMLLSAGMGIGLMFWAVAEPVLHLDSPAPLFGVEAGAEGAGTAALATTFYHWGLHPWAIYALVALALSFFAYNRGLPLTFRSIFYPLLGRRIYGHWGDAIDVLTVLATLFGLATSLGLGVGQAASGLNFLFGLPSGTTFQVVLIVLITAAATISVMAGLDNGVKRLSQVNMGLAGVFMLFLLVVGPAVFVASAFVQSLGFYVDVLPELAFFNEAFSGDNWQGEWTVFYWGWWISWSPFVGMFIARVSKGRTVRELVLGVVLVPTLLSVLWLTVFGGTALRTQLDGVRDIVTPANENPATALFEMLQAFPLAEVTALAGVLLVISFFITSSDSGSLVVDHLTSGGKLDSPKAQRVFWACMEGLLAAVLLMGGGLTALRTASVATGLPFALVLLVLCWSLQKAFHEELDLLEAHYDAEVFRKRHGDLIDQINVEESAAGRPEYVAASGGRDGPADADAEEGDAGPGAGPGT